MDFNLEANQAVDVLDVVPEQYRGLYVQNDAESNFTISPSVKPLADAYFSTRKALVQAQAAKKAANEESAGRRVSLSAIKDVVTKYGVEGEDLAAALDTHLSEMANKTAGGKQLQVDIAQVRSDAEKRIAAMTASKDTEVQAMRTALENHLVGEAAVAAIAKHKGSPELLAPIVRQHVRMVEENGKYMAAVVDENGNAKIGRNGLMSIEEFVSEMKASPVYARAFESEAPAGTGTVPGSMTRKAPQVKKEMSAADKIGAGLRARFGNVM